MNDYTLYLVKRAYYKKQLIKRAAIETRIAGPYDPAKHHGLLNYPLEVFKQVYKDSDGTLGQDYINALQSEFAPKNVVPIGSIHTTFDKKPVKVLHGISPMPLGVDYGK